MGVLGEFLIPCLMVLCIVGHQCEAAGNESNILRLSKPKHLKPNLEASNSTRNGSDATSGSAQKRLMEFSKNNPELDWKTQLRKAAEQEEKMRSKEFDLDFMKDKLQKTANSIQWLADLYDPLRWTKIPGDVSDACRKDMTLFLDNLNSGELWAAKCEFISNLKLIFFY